MNEPKDSKKSPKGLIKFSRVNGNIDCFGSEYQSESYVQLEIVEANVQKNIGKKTYISGKNVVKLRITNHQFSELITNLNNGLNIPCTLEVVKGERMDRYKLEDTTMYDYKDSTLELSKECFELVEKITTQLEELSNAKSASKAKINVIKRDVDNLHTRLKNDIPWLQNRFNEEMLNVLSMIKQEASAWIEHKLIKLGLDKSIDTKKLK